jgi:hypothetical protein
MGWQRCTWNYPTIRDLSLSVKGKWKGRRNEEDDNIEVVNSLSSRYLTIARDLFLGLFLTTNLPCEIFCSI